MGDRLSILLIAAVVFPAWQPALRAADPQPYEVSIEETGETSLDEALIDSSMLLSLREKAPAAPFALTGRAREDRDRFVAALRSFGYYEGKVEITIAGRSVDDPGLLEMLERMPAQPPAEVTVTVKPGTRFRLRNIEIQGTVPPEAETALDLDPGAPALASEVLAARERLLNALRNQGYALAKVDQPVAILDAAARVLDVTYTVDAGPCVDVGSIEVSGLERLNPAFVRRRLPIRTGDRFDPIAIEKSRREIASLLVVASVRVRTADQLDPEGRLPVTFEVAERPPRAVSLGAAFSTDLGGSLSAAWQHRNLFGSAEQLNLAAGVTQLGGNSTTGIGYNLTASFVKPDFQVHDQSLQAGLAAIKQSLDAYDRQALSGEVLISRKLADYWSAALGLSGEQSRIRQQGVTRDYTLLGLPATVRYDSTDSLLDPTEGIRAALTATPIQPLAGPETSPFALVQVSGSGYLDLGEPGRSVLALRGLIGHAIGATQFELPPDKRFYAGGSTTVRGYRYQSVGPVFPDGKPQGGTSVVAGTAEFRQRILDSYGTVLFVDAGQVSADGSPFSDPWRLGAGVGVRYYTGIGPLRMDVAFPITPQPNSSSFELYIAVGQAF